MHYPCPECGARLSGGRPGAILACARCGNPVVVPEPVPRPAVPPAQPPAPAPSGGRAQAHQLWRTAGLVVGVLALAHVALYMLLTSEARADMARIEGSHARQDLAQATAPEDAPAAGTETYGAWRRKQQLWVDAQAWRTHGRQVDLLRAGFTGSFVALLLLTSWILMRVLGAQRRASEAAARAGSRAG